MTLYQFNHLDEMEQAEILWDKGQMIADRRDDVYRYVLYQIDAFYVELKYHMEFNVLHGLRTFASTDKPLEPYLPFMNIDELFPKL